MPSRLSAGLLAAALLAAASPASRAADLKPGAEMPGPLRSFILENSPPPNRFSDPVAAHGLRPGVLVFVLDALEGGKASPAGVLLKGLDDYAANPRVRLGVIDLFVAPPLKDLVTQNEERVKFAGLLRDLATKELGLKKSVVGLDGLEAVQKAGYPVTPEAGLLVVLFDELRVKEVFSFPPGKADADAVLKAVRERLAPVRK